MQEGAASADAGNRRLRVQCSESKSRRADRPRGQHWEGEERWPSEFSESSAHGRKTEMLTNFVSYAD